MWMVGVLVFRAVRFSLLGNHKYPADRFANPVSGNWQAVMEEKRFRARSPELSFRVGLLAEQDGAAGDGYMLIRAAISI